MIKLRDLLKIMDDFEKNYYQRKKLCNLYISFVCAQIS